MNEILGVAFIDNSMKYFQEEREPIEMQHAQNQAQENHDTADRFVSGKLRRERVIRESCVGEPLHNDKTSPEPGQNHQYKWNIANFRVLCLAEHPCTVNKDVCDRVYETGECTCVDAVVANHSKVEDYCGCMV